MPRTAPPSARSQRWAASFAAVLLSLTCQAAAADGDQSANSPFWKRNVRFAIDIAGRGTSDSKGHKPASALLLGADVQKIFSSARGDVGTLLLQGYLIRIDNLERHPGFPNDDHDTAFEFRNFYFNYTGFARNRANLKLGHFELPYGLEAVVDTNGTLRDYSLGTNVGIKADWGLSLNGTLPRFEYEVGLSRGSGNAWTATGDPYAVVGRIGTTRDRTVVVGLSGFTGRIVAADRPTGTVQRSRVGVDAQWELGASRFLSEVSLGHEDHRGILHGVVEADLSSPERGLMGYAQLLVTRVATPALDDQSVQLVLGAAFEPDGRWSASLQWSRDLRVPVGKQTGGAFAVQIRHR
jgi:hypothetical protein